MKEFDIKSIWEGAEHDAKQWYQHLRPELISRAKKQNDNVLHKIRRLVIMELLSSSIAVMALLYYLRHLDVWLLVFSGLFFLVLLYIGFHQYSKFKRKADSVPSMNIVASTKAYLRLINDYQKRLFRIATFLMPISILIGFFLGFMINEGNHYSDFFASKNWLLLLPILFVLTIISLLATKWYYRYFIGSKEKELQTVLASLLEVEEE